MQPSSGLAASKRPLAASGTDTSNPEVTKAKQPRLDTADDAAVEGLFRAFKEQLDAKQDRRERIVKLSRDATTESKRVIFTLHRVAGASDAERAAVLAEANQRLDKLIGSKLQPIAAELAGLDQWEYRRAYTLGLQELVEALAFYEFLSSGRLLSLAELRARLPTGLLAAPFDHLLGVCDLSGELMRLAINAGARADLVTPVRVLAFLQDLLGCCEAVTERGPDWFPKDFAGKLEVMRQSVEKVEKMCYQQCLRRMEEVDVPVG